MRIKTFTALCTIAAIFFFVAVSQADVNFKVLRRLKLESTPLDIEMSKSGRWLYILTKNGHLKVYSFHGAFIGQMAVGEAIDQIEPGPTDERLYLKSSSKKSIQVLEVTYDHTISTDGSPYKGRKDAPIVIVDYSDFQCPYCARLVLTFQELLKRYPDKIKIVYKNYPLRGHKFSKKAASAAMAAHLKGNFWPFHDQLFAHYHNMNDDVINNIRKELKLDTAEFDKLMQSPKVQSMIEKDIIQGRNIGVTGTPSVFVNGKIQKDKRLEGFIQTIEKELRALKK